MKQKLLFSDSLWNLVQNRKSTEPVLVCIR